MYNLIVIKLKTFIVTANVLHFDEYGVGANIIMMLVSGVLFMSICLLKDHLIFERIIYKFKNKNLPQKHLNAVDDDVANEVEKIKKMTNSQILDGNLVLRGLSKFYKSNLAVNQLYLGVDNAECFGLLVFYKIKFKSN